MQTVSTAIIQSQRTFEEIEATWKRTERDWWSLFSEPDCWLVPEKREEMLRARWAYQDAKITYICALWKNR